ncbi:uncharacterized protein ACHE_60260S [Aspergillus chevalieri]|uniref:Uncharacterized protein n=1 Tax=Aspergillus chevalieri TaxID=182096 RepID=A0A7R7VTA4_ASPCH|nr:uncharacterized protein ACHE_60260S [Aspergillus chevalieri]BCR90374.1 hypothetical protein ACHE_60260S [Aspergillus chevalieri]
MNPSLPFTKVSKLGLNFPSRKIQKKTIVPLSAIPVNFNHQSIRGLESGIAIRRIKPSTLGQKRVANPQILRTHFLHVTSESAQCSTTYVMPNHSFHVLLLGPSLNR